MKHEEIKDLLSDYHDGELSWAEKAVVAPHLVGCADCRHELACYVKGEELIRAATRRPTSFETETLVSAVRRRVEPAPEIAWLGRHLASPRWAVSAFTVAFAALVMTVRASQVKRVQPAHDDPAEVMLISRDGGQIYALMTSAPETVVAGALALEVR